MAALVARVRELFQKTPAARYGLVGVVLVLAVYLVVSRLSGGGVAPSASRPVPSAPSAVPAPRAAAPAPAPAPAGPKTPAESVVPSGPSGRPDPFIPVVTAPAPGQALPPAPFPGQLPPPPLPGQGPSAFPAGGLTVTGIVGDSRAVAIINIGGHTEILTVGEQIGDMRVLRIDSTRRVVTFLQAGRRFDVAMGGE